MEMEEKVWKADIKSLTLKELESELNKMGEKSFCSKQIYQWIHEKNVISFHEMTNISQELKEKLSAGYQLLNTEMVERQISKIDGTNKFLFRLWDNKVIESVLMKYKHGNSVCISSQVGCRMGCNFCASAIGGLERNLLPSEMLSQIYEIQKITGERVSNVVVMGTGEPLDNLENLIKYIQILTHENGLNISQRNITVSTCGLVPAIYELAKEKLQITLAISLHASNDIKRKALMPVAKKYSIDEIIKACKYYYKETGRRITFEYALSMGENDGEKDAKDLCSILKGLNCHVNLIPINPIKERKYKDSAPLAVENFKKILEKYRINVTIRREMGRDIEAACGQLRKSHIENTI